ncbi:putative membrane protein [Chryseobacterium ginsenosidimutans]|uniref:DUF1361 domain-containing protein n=1 Tax=Chryseobacterium ginsenosidimutans TaxID=687846 RepID=UPI0027812891|nr:DUF1361 domain-containing protein [Chryseobacterium ginsenosidimutans]MDQ0591674.1 putative membrane protein [Chryseobacterium ginsenosidimutans]
MIKKLEENGRFEITLLLVFMTIFCFSLSIFRYYISETKVFFFLNWNLFLAGIPFLISSSLLILNIRSKFSLIIAITVWILFFPNFPYILTDLFHLKIRSSVPIWYDLVVILSYAWTGLFYGFISLRDIEELLSVYFRKSTISIITVSFLFLASFGVYLGRFLRWNSWDILSNSFGLFNNIVVRIIYQMEYTRTWGITILMGIMLNFMYFMIRSMKNINKEIRVKEN